MHQHMMHQMNPHLHGSVQFYDDQRLGTLSAPGQHFADMSDLRSEADKPMSKGLKGLSMSVPDLTGEFDGKNAKIKIFRKSNNYSDGENDNTFRPISPDLVDPTIAARQRAAEMEELKKQSLAFTANLARKNETISTTTKGPIMKMRNTERKTTKKYQSDSGVRIEKRTTPG